MLLLLASLFVMSCAAPYSTGKYSEFIPNDQGEFGDYFEGDMILSEKQQQAISQATENRNGLKSSATRWPNRTVVYDIVQDDFDEDQVELIEKVMSSIASESCLKFRPREGDEHAVIIEGSAPGCFSCVGLCGPDERQVLNLGKRCLKYGTIAHEMIHTIGFYHMQSTYDRDDHVKILWENIIEGKEHNFQKYNNDTVTDFGVPYDYSSIMHYPGKAFSKNGLETIIPLKENVTIGLREAMSEYDILKLNKMYCEDVEAEEN